MHPQPIRRTPTSRMAGRIESRWTDEGDQGCDIFSRTASPNRNDPEMVVQGCLVPSRSRGIARPSRQGRRMSTRQKKERRIHRCCSERTDRHPGVAGGAPHRRTLPPFLPGDGSERARGLEKRVDVWPYWIPYGFTPTGIPADCVVRVVLAKLPSTAPPVYSRSQVPTRARS